MKKRLMIALCCLVLLVQLLPVVPMADTVAIDEIPQDLYYCREQLKTLNNSAALLFAYDNIVAGIDAYADEIIISNKQYQVTKEEFEMVLEATRRDHTEQFWMGTSYTPYVNSKNIVEKIVPTFNMTKEELADAKVAFNQAIDNMIAQLTPGMSEYEMEKALHDMLANKVTYVSTPNAHNAYGALVEGYAVCEGYAEALQCLLQRVGIQSVEVFGYGINPATGGGEPHAWNIVRIDGEYYTVDLTWNDQDDYNMLLYAYFNQTSENLSRNNHEQWRVGRKGKEELPIEVFELPVCTATKANYFVKNNLVISSYSIESIGTALKENNLSYTFYLDGDPAAFEAWYGNEANISEIAKAAGVSGVFYYGIVPFGSEIRIYIETCEHTQLKPVAAKAATCDTEGNIAYYICQGKDCGKWFSDSKAEVEIVNREGVKVAPTGHDFTVKTVSDATLKKKAEKCTEHDAYYLICAVCGVMSDTYTFDTEVIGAHAYSETWVADGVTNHKRACTNGCGEALYEAHSDKDDVKGCDACGYVFSIADLVPDTDDIDGEEITNGILDMILSNPLILGGGGGGILLVIIVVIISKIRQG